MTTTRPRSSRPRRTSFRCSSCGAAAPVWAGRCTGCEEWNTLVEERTAPVARSIGAPVAPARPIADVA
ncbi:MAG TPA: hypothetical protein VGE43_07710, partial [Acidimicrobiales bacterium]